MVKVDGQLYLVSGFDDGVVTLLEMKKLNGVSMKRPVFSTKSKDNETNAQALDQGTYDQWHEQAYEHSDSIISVDASAAESTADAPVRVLTASKDGCIYVWAVNGESNGADDKLSYIADVDIDEPLSKVKWLT